MEIYTGRPVGIWEEAFHFASPCSQRILIDLLNVLFLIFFFLMLVVQSVRSQQCTSENTRKDRVFLTCSICCAFASIAHFSVCLWEILLSNSSTHSSSILYGVQGVIWFSLSVSLFSQRAKLLKSFHILWWVTFSLLASAFNLEIIVKTHTIPILDLVVWPVNLLLLYCALRLFGYSTTTDPSEENLYEPLSTGKAEPRRSDLGKSNFLSQLTFSWLNPLLRSGYLKPLVFDDIPSLVPEDEAFIAYQSFLSIWDHMQPNKSSDRSNGVLWALVKVHSKDLIITGIYAFLKSLTVVASPLLLYAFVQYSSLDEENLVYGLLLTGCLIVIKIVECLSQRHLIFNARRSGMRMRSALMVAVYKKQLKLSSLGRQRHSTGEIVNYISVDAYRMGEFPFWFHSTWSCVLQLFLSIGVLFGIIGVGALPGLFPLFICGLLNIPFAKVIQYCQTQFMVAQDKRLRNISEVLNSMKVIKLHSWEEKFKTLIESLRDVEYTWLHKSQMIKVYGTTIYWMTPTLVSSIIFIGCAVTGSVPLNASTIFTILSTLRCMSQPVRTIPDALSILIQVKVSLDRLQVFFMEDEQKDEYKRCSPNSGINISISSAVFCWNKDTVSPTLKAIDLEVKPGQKIAVCGPVGSGKSSLLYAILGEITIISGHVDRVGCIAYVSQIAWIQSGTIRDNILYGKPMDNTRYEMTIKSCALDKEIDSFSHGDLTEIGQRGINLSGGQKQRIQLARAVYNDADLYLLDDPFSAVDAHTAATLFNKCVLSALKNKTVILVTHQVEFLAEADRILVMEGGWITQSGSYEDLLSSGTAFEQLVNAHKTSMTISNPPNNVYQDELNMVDKNLKNVPNQLNSNNGNRVDEISENAVAGVQLTEAEEIEIGNVVWKPFSEYIRVSNGLFLLILSILAQCAFSTLQLASTYWLAIASQSPHISNGTLVGVYTGISVSSAGVVCLRTYFTVLLGLKASRAFFSNFMNSVFGAPMLFFDSTPIGRILIRASSDLSVLDCDIPYSTGFLIGGIVEMVIIIGVMASVTWPVLVMGILALLAAKYVEEYYLASARELIRINGTTKAPVMNFAAETSLGVATIRAYEMTNRFFQNYLKLIDADATLFFHSSAAVEWLIIRVEALQNLTLFTAVVLLILLPKGTIAPGLVGLSLSYSLNLTACQVFMTQRYCNLSNYIISAERIMQFMNIPSESPAIVDDKRPPASWPSKGRIDLHNLKIRYRPNAPLVLKGITCSVKEGTRMGVVGRTGSGKTTLISALFRLIEPESGRILIDDLDICSIGLRDLRMKLSIIPQEPTLFKGTVRTNMDPLGLYSDQQIWEAIEKCQLKATILSLPNLLDSSVSDEGDNLSVGQRQLFCLGRVLLKRSKILVLDEATASIDSATDAILQRVIRNEFSNCTVITIAHRVPTVIDSDMVMVLSYGKMVE